MSRATGPTTDWGEWMRGMGRYTRRLRELVGLSQEELARRAGVSQGALSRLELGRAPNAPLVVVMRVNAAMRTALASLDPRLLSRDTRRLMGVTQRKVPRSAAEFETFPVTVDPLLAEHVRLFWKVPEPDRDQLLVLVRAAATALHGRRRRR